ncbi:MAG: PD-(D/E)XK nuclease family protein [Cyanobacteria bacterium J06598_3]
MLPISQGHLNVLDVCDRKYQYIFFDALSGPASYDQQLTTQWGSQFHLLMQQRALNLPVEALAAANAEMAESMAALAQTAPDIFEHLSSQPTSSSDELPTGPAANQTFSEPFSQSEHRRTLEFEDYLLTVVYDLVVGSPTQGQIFDWKTHQNPPREDQLQQDWQTRLYLYVLCETSGLRAEQLSMTYWFVRLGHSALHESALNESASDKSASGASESSASASSSSQRSPSFYRFGYSTAQHRRTRTDLQRLTHRLTQMRQSGHFPKVDIEKGRCDRCPFAVRCDRLTSSFPLSDEAQKHLREARQISVETVAEIPL